MPNREQLMDLYKTQKENTKKTEALRSNQLINELQNNFYCSPKCKKFSEKIIKKVEEDLDNYMFKPHSYFDFLLSYPSTKIKLNELNKSIAEFKLKCKEVKELPKAVKQTF
mmetsp:Transcript_10939/g.9667  ORF Transcript_10939/g.9667 Transcript_10939/m.9667 type:complete len:111 (+) Transcript_10939:389-721(+)